MSNKKVPKQKPTEQDIFWYNDNEDEQEFKQHIGFTDSKFVRNNHGVDYLDSSENIGFLGYN